MEFTPRLENYFMFAELRITFSRVTKRVLSCSDFSLIKGETQISSFQKLSEQAPFLYIRTLILKNNHKVLHRFPLFMLLDPIFDMSFMQLEFNSTQLGSQNHFQPFSFVKKNIGIHSTQNCERPLKSTELQEKEEDQSSQEC